MIQPLHSHWEYEKAKLVTETLLAKLKKGGLSVGEEKALTELNLRLRLTDFNDKKEVK